MAKESQEPEVEAKEENVEKFLFYGVTEDSERIMKYVKNQKDYKPIFLTKEEMDAVVIGRMSELRRKEIEGFVDDERHAQRAFAIAVDLQKNYEKEFEKHEYLSTSYIKKRSQLSWTKFKEVIGTLDIFGHIQWEDEKKTSFKVLLDADAMLDNKIADLKSTFDFAKGQILEIKRKYGSKLKEDDLKAVNALDKMESVLKEI